MLKLYSNKCHFLICPFQVGGLPAEASAEAKAQAERLKNDGNNLMKSEQFNEALSCYSKY